LPFCRRAADGHGRQGFTVDELCPVFDGGCEVGRVQRPHAAADAIARFKEQHVAP